MRLDFVKVFRDSTNEMLQQIVGPVDEMDAMSMHAMPLAGRDVTAVIELDGPMPHRVPVSRAKIAEVKARLGLARRHA